LIPISQEKRYTIMRKFTPEEIAKVTHQANQALR